MKRAITLSSILGLAITAFAAPQTGPPAAQTNNLVIPQLLSPAHSVLMTNAEFRCVSGDKILFKNGNDYESFHAADLSADILAALDLTAAQLEVQQRSLDAAKQRYDVQVAASQLAALAAPAFTATDIFGKTVKLGDYKGKIVVLEAYRSVGCPYCEAHYRTGAMQELQREATSNGVVWLLINFDSPRVGQSPERARQEWGERNMVITDYIIDTDGSQIGRKYAFKTAPSAIVIAQNGTIAYQGAVDEIGTTTLNMEEDRVTTGGPGTPIIHVPMAELLAGNYVRAALEALLAGRRPLLARTPSYGCPLANLYR